MEELKELRRRMEEDRPQPWSMMPDIGLYMDQLISYMPRQLIHYGEGEVLTSAMVNNYIKDGVLPRAEGKRYARTHLAYLTAICALKQVLPVREVRLLVQSGVAGRDSEATYEHFRQALDEALSETAQSLDEDLEAEDLPRLALALALRSYADQLACRRLLDILAQQQPQEERPEKGHGRSRKELKRAEKE